MLRLNLLVLLLIKSVQCEEDRNISSIYKQLRADIFKDYDRNARPVSDNSKVTTINVEMHLTSKFEIDEERQTIDVDSYMAVHWTDLRLTWNYTQYERIFMLQVSPNDVWMPDIYAIQRGGPTSDIQQSDFSFAIVRSGGNIHWFVATPLPGRCKFDYNNYPNDIAICTVILEAWSYRKQDVVIDSVTVLNYGKGMWFPKPINSQWELTDTVGEKKIWDMYSSAYVTFTMARKTPILQQQLLWIASVIVVLLTLGMFWIPSDIEQKITVGCVMMVIMTAVLLTVASSVGARQPVILIAGTVHSLMYISTAAILLEIVAINFQHIQEWKPPEFLLNIFSGTVGRILLISSAQQDMPSLDKMKLSEYESGDVMMEQLITTGTWKTISQALDRVAFLIYIVVLSAVPKTP